MNLSSEEERSKIEARAAKFGGHTAVWSKRLEDEAEAKKKVREGGSFRGGKSTWLVQRLFAFGSAAQ